MINKNFVTWQDDRTGELHIYAQRFDNAGQTVVAVRVDDTSAVYDRYTLAIAVAPGDRNRLAGKISKWWSLISRFAFSEMTAPVSDIINKRSITNKYLILSPPLTIS
ncbi:MAG: hypothetical protein R3C26_03240 [Calditrichia bacterium]